MEDVEAFLGWLRAQGLPDAHVDAYRYYVAELAKHPSLSAALRAAEEAGTPARQIANLRQTAARMAEFESSRGMAKGSNPATPAPAPTRVRDELTLEPEPVRRPVRASVAPEPRIRRGCSCKKRYDVYLDNDFGGMASMLGGGIGIGTIIMIRLFGIVGALAIALGCAGMGGFVTIFSICLRCEGCRNKVHDLDEDERAHVRKGRALVVLVTAGLWAGAALCGFVWWRLAMARQRGY